MLRRNFLATVAGLIPGLATAAKVSPVAAAGPIRAAGLPFADCAALSRAVGVPIWVDVPPRSSAELLSRLGPPANRFLFADLGGNSTGEAWIYHPDAS